jgi:PAS domain S-box-containing protein
LTSSPSARQALRKQAEMLVQEKISLENTDNLSPAEVKQMLHELQVHQVELEMQNEELRRAQEALDVSLARYLDLYDFAPVGYITLSEQGLILEANLTVATLLGKPRSALIRQLISGFIFKEDQDIYYRHRKLLFESGNPQECELRMVNKDGAIFWVRLGAIVLPDSAGAPTCRIVVNDITEIKRAEDYREMGREALQILNEPGNQQESIQRVLSALKTRTGAEAAGIRLQNGDDFPYFSQQGFSDDFLLTENTLVKRAADGGVCRDKDGTVCLECTCGLVLSGKTDPENPYFTHGGSCWTNDTADTPFKDTKLHTRGRCLHDGFKSLALVPIRNQNKIVGLIQLNDRRKGLFTLDVVIAMEGIASYIGAALMRKQAEEELLEKERLQGVLEMAGAVCHELSQPLQVISGFSSILRMDMEESNPLYKPVKGIEAGIFRADTLMKKIMGITRYQSKPYLKNNIVDIEKASHHEKE